jgi:hypothetical protein
MYFIPRNNKLYHYFVYIRPRNRYLITAFIMIFTIFINITLYYIADRYTFILEQELASTINTIADNKNKTRAHQSFVKKHKQLESELTQLTDEVYQNNQMFTFLLDSITANGLHLNTIAVNNNKAASAQTKENVSLQVSGQLPQIMQWLKKVKDSQFLVESSAWTLTNDANRYTWVGDMCYLKKSLQLNQAEGLGG